MALKIYYSVMNCGDGSAYPVFFQDELSAEIHQSLEEEGWGEPCTGTLEIAGENVVCREAQSRKDYIKELKKDLKESRGYTEAERINQIEEAIEKLKKSK